MTEHKPGYLFNGKVRISTLVLVIAFIAASWLYQYNKPAPPPPAQPAQWGPPPYIPNPDYTPWPQQPSVTTQVPKKTTTTTTTPTTTTRETNTIVTTFPTTTESTPPTPTTTTTAPGLLPPWLQLPTPAPPPAIPPPTPAPPTPPPAP